MVTPVLIQPDWPAPAHIHALSTTRLGGVSLPPYDSFNLGDHVNDEPDHVLQNRQQLSNAAELSSKPLWLNQTHSSLCVNAKDWQPNTEADACYSQQQGDVCIVMTADCLPLLVCDFQGQEVAAIHAGWRGLCQGVIESTLSHFKAPASDLLVWLGPAISSKAFEVGSEVRHAFIMKQAEATSAFIQSDEQHYFADIYQLARQRLYAQGVEAIYGGDRCTYNEPEHFFSYRRDGQTGRMASLIWKDNK
jgi:hypothetical protein